MARILERIGALVKREAIRRCPVDNGWLRTSIDFETNPAEGSVTIFSDVEYAPYVEFGTGVFHQDKEGNPDPRSGWDIFPVNAKALRFEVGRKARLSDKGGLDTANIVFAKKVHIEGAEPHPFLRPAVHQSKAEIDKIILEEIKK